MEIQHINYSPNDTYFRTGDVEPDLTEDGALRIYNGEGDRRGWGAPGVTSTVVVNGELLTAIHVGFHHKHGGGQFWRYYAAGEQKTWVGLTVEQQAAVLAAYKEGKAPAWAKVPGVLKTERKPATIVVKQGFKLVGQRADGTLFSLYDPETVYLLGKRMAEAARPSHGGGFYFYPSQETLLAAWEAGRVVPRGCLNRLAVGETVVLIAVEASGTFVRYGNGKVAATYLRPTAILGPAPAILAEVA